MIDDEMISVEVTELLADHGTIVVFAGHTEEGVAITFAADHAMAGPLAEAVMLDNHLIAAVPTWAIMNSRA